MKKLIIAVTLMMLAIGSAQAQDDSGDRGGRHGGKHRGDPLTHLTEKLDLSDEQAIEVATILEESREQHRAIQESVQPEHCAVRDNTFAELATVLNEEQLAQFEDLQNKGKNRGRSHGMPRFANCDD